MATAENGDLWESGNVVGGLGFARMSIGQKPIWQEFGWYVPYDDEKVCVRSVKGKKNKKKEEFQKKGVEKVTKSALGGSSIGRVNRRIGKVGKT